VERKGGGGRGDLQREGGTVNLGCPAHLLPSNQDLQTEDLKMSDTLFCSLTDLRVAGLSWPVLLSTLRWPWAMALGHCHLRAPLGWTGSMAPAPAHAQCRVPLALLLRVVPLSLVSMRLGLLIAQKLAQSGRRQSYQAGQGPSSVLALSLFQCGLG
jgi:hypothetical protein